MTMIIVLTLLLSPFVVLVAYAVYLKIQRNKAGLGPVLVLKADEIGEVGEYDYVGAFGARESWSDMRIEDNKG